MTVAKDKMEYVKAWTAAIDELRKFATFDTELHESRNHHLNHLESIMLEASKKLYMMPDGENYSTYREERLAELERYIRKYHRREDDA